MCTDVYHNMARPRFNVAYSGPDPSTTELAYMTLSRKMVN